MTTTSLITDRVIDSLSGVESEAKKMLRGDRRAKSRHPYCASVGLMLISPTGYRFAPIVLQARDLSIFGISVISQQMIHPGSDGAVQLVRSDGTIAIVGGVVRHCRYLGGMLHATGIEFGPLPYGLETSEFLDADGRLELFGPELSENCPGSADRVQDP